MPLHTPDTHTHTDKGKAKSSILHFIMTPLLKVHQSFVFVFFLLTPFISFFLSPLSRVLAHVSSAVWRLLSMPHTSSDSNVEHDGSYISIPLQHAVEKFIKFLLSQYFTSCIAPDQPIRIGLYTAGCRIYNPFFLRL